MTPADAPSPREHILLCGLGHVGFRLLNLLHRLGESVTIITDRTHDDWQALVERHHFPLFIGDARDERLLLQAGIAGAKALIAATDDDLANVTIALDAKRLNPGLTVVLRLFDQPLAAHFESSFEVRRALSTSALAAPAFAAAAMGERVLAALAAEGAPYLIEEEALEAGSPWLGRTAALWRAETGAGLLALSRDGEVVLDPPDGTDLRPGDALVFCREAGRPWRHGRTGASRASAPAGAGPSSSPAEKRPGQWWRRVPTTLRIALGALLLVIGSAVLFFHYTRDLSLLDSLYFVVTVVTTVGFGDINLLDAAPGVKVFGIFLMLCGAALIAVLFGIVTDFIVTTRFRELMGRRGGRRRRGHVIVAGLGNIGFRAVEELIRGGREVVGIEPREGSERVAALRTRIPVLTGDAKAEEILRSAGVERASAVLALTDDDVTNLSVGLLTRRLSPACRVVLRVFDPDLARSMRQSAAVDAVLSASEVAAPTLVASALHPDVRRAFALRDGLALVLRHATPRGAPEIGRPFAEIFRTTGELSFLRRRAGETGFSPVPRDSALGEGDEHLALVFWAFRKPNLSLRGP